MTNLKKMNLLVKSSLWYVIAALIGQGMSFLGMGVFTRLMDQTDYGTYTTYYAYVSIFTVLIGGNLYYALNNAYIDKKKIIKAFRKDVLVLATIIMVGILTLALITGTLVLHKFSSFIIIMAALHSFAFFVVNYRIYSANMEDDYRTKLWLLILPNTLQFFGSLALVLLFPHISYAARVVGSTAGIGCVASIIYIQMLQCNGKLINCDDWKYALSIAIPTIPMSISYMLMQQCDKMMITDICGADETAVYSVIYYIGYAVIAVDQAAAPARQSWIFKCLDQGKMAKVKKIQKWYLIVMALLATGVMYVGPEMIKLLVPVSYWKFEYIVPFVLSACMMLLYRFFTEIILFYKKNILLSVCVFICALINIGLNAILIGRFGAVIACYTTMVAYSILFLMTGIVSNKCAGSIYSKKLFGIFVTYMIMMAMVCHMVSKIILIRYMVFLMILGLALGYIIKKRSEWKYILWEDV